MHVLFLTPYFPPDVGSAQRQMHQLSTRLAAMGHEVTVLTAVPHYPTGVIPREYRKKLCVYESIDGVLVIRTWIYATRSQHPALRMLNHLSFMIAAVSNLRALSSDIDVIYTDSPPLFDGLAAYVLGRLRSVPYVFNVADLWPQIVFENGMLTSSPLRQMAQGLERFIYLNASQITAVTQGFRQAIVAKGFQRNRVHHIPLGTDVDQFTPKVNGTQWRERLGAGNRCLVMYAGTHGKSQSLHTLLGAAQLLRTEPQILFCLVGEGPEKTALMQIAKNRGLSNVKFINAQPLREMPAVVGAADVHVVPLRDIPLFRMTIPGKIYEILAAGKPIVGALSGEAATLIERAGAGLTVPPADERAVADAIRFMVENPQLRVRFGDFGRAHVIANYSYRKIAKLLEEVLIQAQALGRYHS